MKAIPLTKGLVAIVDDEDEVAVNRWKWHAYVRAKNKTAYAIRNTTVLQKRTTQALHQFIAQRMGIEGEVDHADGNGLICTRDNLRPASHSQQTANQSIRKDNTSGVKGVTWCKRKSKWHGSVTFKGKRRFVGYFNDLSDAANAVSIVRKEMHGEFARFQ